MRSPPITYIPSPNSFYISGYWHHCRDRILYYLNTKQNINGIYFICENPTKVRKFLVKFQNKSKIPVSSRFKIYKTERSDVLYIKLTDFWKNSLRFSLLTAICRCAVSLTNVKDFAHQPHNYNGYYTMYFSHNRSFYALQKFMDGYHEIDISHYNASVSHATKGWLEHFSGMSLSEIDKGMKKSDVIN